MFNMSESFSENAFPRDTKEPFVQSTPSLNLFFIDILLEAQQLLSGDYTSAFKSQSSMRNQDI